MNEAIKPSTLRDLMPALENKTYFNYGGQGPLPLASLQAITKSWHKIQELGPFTSKVWPYVEAETEQTRKLLSKLCGVSSNRLALTENVTSGCLLPLLGLPFSKGDRLIISDCEHPGIVFACRELARRKQLKIDNLPVKKLLQGVNQVEEVKATLLEDLDSLMRKNTRLVVLSHILWNTGQLMPIPALAKRLAEYPNHPFLLVDAAQSFGQISVKEAANEADIYAFTGHKWACGPEGLGAVAVSERLLNESQPTVIGWRSLQYEGSPHIQKSNPFHSDSRRFEVATSCIPLMAGLRCSLDLLENEGSEIERHRKIQGLSSSLWATLQKLETVETILKGPPPAGLVSFVLSLKESPQAIVKQLGRQNIWLRTIEDPHCLRACLHVTSEKEDIALLHDNLKKLISIY